MIANDVKFLCIDDGPLNFAHVDSVTGLPNLARIRPAITRAFEDAAAREATAALAIVSLDRFHVVDERFGRSIADDILREVARLLRAQAAQFPFAARVGTDEFMIAMPNLVDGQEASVLMHQLLASLAVPRRIDGHGLRLRGSAGIALYPVDGRNLEDLFRKAGGALADAQRLAPGTLRFHSGNVAAHALARARLRNGLRDALHHEQLTLHYQPQFEVGSGALCGVEALARWTPPSGAPVPPAVFVPLAEQTGLIAALGSWALRTGCRESAPWQLEGQNAPTVAVNVSPHQICAAFTADIEAALAASGLEPQRLELEITESVLVANLDQTRKCLSAWKSLGVRIALDDFGSGYANFGYLAHLPIDRLKIDRSLTRGLANGIKDATIIRAVIALGRELGFTVLAEGVETAEQLSMLQEYGCQQAQGFLFAHPAPAAAMPAVMGRPWGGATLAAGAGRTLQ